MNATIRQPAGRTHRESGRLTEAPADRLLKLAYALQNVGSVDLGRDLGDSVPVRYGLRGLRHRGHTVDILRLQGRRVTRCRDVDQPEDVEQLTSGLPGWPPFKGFESAVRRVQRTLRLPYFAFFDSYRFYDAVLRALPRFDLLHEHNGLFSVGSALACARAGKPYVLTFSADPIMEMDLTENPLGGLHRETAERMAAMTYRRADAILCVSRAAQSALVERWGVASQKIKVMPNAVDIELFHPGAAPVRVPEVLAAGGGPVVAFLGGFQPWHGLELLLESFARLLASGRRAKLLLIGDGPVRSEVEDRLQLLGLASHAHITGLIPQREVPGMLALADIAVIPYPRLPQELWFSPLKLYEYMAAGKAILASGDGQIAEVLVDGQTGLLHPPGDVDAMLSGLIRLVDSPELRRSLGEHARRQAEASFSWEVYARRLESVYFEVLDGHGTGKR